jgi:molybdopterin-synthase adenylyltransferase
VQVAPSEQARLSLDELARKLSTAGEVTSNPYLVRVSLREPALQMTVFRDGRAIIKGTEDMTAARAVYARYVGS